MSAHSRPATPPELHHARRIAHRRRPAAARPRLATHVAPLVQGSGLSRSVIPLSAVNANILPQSPQLFYALSRENKHCQRKKNYLAKVAISGQKFLDRQATSPRRPNCRELERDVVRRSPECRSRLASSPHSITACLQFHNRLRDVARGPLAKQPTDPCCKRAIRLLELT